MLEFTSVSVSSYEASNLSDELQRLSGEGWTVVSIVNAGSDIVAYLSRQASGAPQEHAAAPRLSNQPKKAGLAGACSQLHLKQRRAPNLPRLRPQRQRLQAGTPTPRVDMSSATGTETNGPSTCRGRDSNQPTLPSPNPCAQHLSVMPESSLSVRPGRFSATRGLSRRSSVHGLSSPKRPT